MVELQVASMLSNIEFSPYPGTAVILGQKKERKRSERLLTDNFNRNYVRFLTLVEMLSTVVRKEESQRRVRVLAVCNCQEGALDVAVSA